MYARSRPALGTSILERYPASLAQLKWDKDMDQPGEDTRRSFFQIPAPKNWHLGKLVGDVPVTQPMAGEISYLPLKGQATLPDGNTVHGVYGYALFLWGGRRLKHDCLVKGDGLEMPVALLLESGLDKRTYAPGTIFPDTIQSIDEALAAYGLILVREL